MSIASHYCLDQLKRPYRNSVSLDDFLSECYFPGNPAAQPEAVLLNKEATTEVRHLLKILPPHDRVVVILKYWQALSYQEIAQILDTTVSAIKSKLFKARRKMAQAIEQQNGQALVFAGLLPEANY